jgi:hypothetical protein
VTGGSGAIPRPLVEFVCPERLCSSSQVTPVSLDPVEVKILSGDVDAGDAAILIELPEGWRGRSPNLVSAGFELVVLEGELSNGTTRLLPESYVSVPADGRGLDLSCSMATLAFLDLSAHVREERIVPASAWGWSAPRVPGPRPGLIHKLVRGDPLTGPSAFLLRVPAGWSEMRTEWHECAEQCVILDGDLWHDRANGGAGGTMTKHCYFWRPPFVLHSPMGTTHGASMFITTDGALVNHYLEEEGLPPANARVDDS